LLLLFKEYISEMLPYVSQIQYMFRTLQIVRGVLWIQIHGPISFALIVGVDLIVVFVVVHGQTAVLSN
jgi:hypothetical protein